MNPKIILVTGANKGIGFEIVRQLAKLGHTVILTARNPMKGMAAQQELKNENLSIHFLQLDITNKESSDSAFQKIKTDFGKLDVLINNAAILLKEDHSLVKDDFKIFSETINNNSIAQLTLTRTLLPLMSSGGRIIFTSSGGGSMSDPVGGWSPAYCISKSLVNAMARHLASELSDRTISVNAFDPGWVKTDMGGKSAPRTVTQGADTAVWLTSAETISTGTFYRDRKVIAW